MRVMRIGTSDRAAAKSDASLRQCVHERNSADASGRAAGSMDDYIDRCLPIVGTMCQESVCGESESLSLLSLALAQGSHMRSTV